jgi:hypothetical protein
LCRFLCAPETEFELPVLDCDGVLVLVPAQRGIDAARADSSRHG